MLRLLPTTHFQIVAGLQLPLGLEPFSCVSKSLCALIAEAKPTYPAGHFIQ